MEFALDPQVVREAERYICAAALLSPRLGAWVEATQEISSDSFRVPKYGALFEVCMQIGATGQECDLRTVELGLDRRGNLKLFGGVGQKAGNRTPLDELGELVSGPDTVLARSGAALKQAADTVREAAFRRRIVLAARELNDVGLVSENPRDALLDQLAKLDALIGPAGSQNPERTIGKATEEMVAQLRHEHKHGADIIDLGIPALDHALGGLRPGRQVVIAARPAGGKSAFLLEALMSFVRQDWPTLFFQMEMQLADVAKRLAAGRTDVPASFLNVRGDRDETLESLHWPKLDALAEELSQYALRLIERPLPLPAVRQRVMRFRRDHPNSPGIVFAVDYVGLVPVEQRRTREQEVAHISQTLGTLAKQVSGVSMLLVQLRRPRDPRSDRATMDDLRESGQLEQDADAIMLLHPPNFRRLAKQGEGMARRFANAIEIELAKNRFGPVGTFPVWFVRHKQRFDPMVDADIDAYWGK